MSIQITEYKPVHHLRPFVEFFWEGEFNTALQSRFNQLVAPNGFIELIIHRSDQHCNLPIENSWIPSPDYTIIGLHTKPYEVLFRNLVKAFGIRFKPEGIYNLFGIPASLFSERYEDMNQVLGTKFDDFCSRLTETEDTHQRISLSTRYLMDQLEKHNPDLTYVNRAAEIIRESDGFKKIETLPEKVYISLRQLEREFKLKIGTTPKRYMRIFRLNEVHRKLENGEQLELTKVAFDCGYADQAHFIRDFKSIMGVNPTVFIKNRHQFIVNS